MLNRLRSLVIIFSMLFHQAAKADEGMWLPVLLKKLNEADMKKEGLQLSIDEIYNINHSSMKDAIVRLSGGFCTAEMISSEGLMLTNHHCAYESIQANSSIENDYLSQGFWAQTRDQELQCPGLTADFLIRVEDVTARVKNEVSDTLTEQQRNVALQKTYAAIIKEASDSNGYKAEVKPFLKGNEFYLFIYQIFPDVRLAGVPPSAIGKFGGDSDNWMWPRQTGDFTLMRVYTGKDGKPANYSKDNVPFKPRYFLPISLDGIKKDDFAFILGYPGNTDRYLTSEGIALALSVTNPATIEIRKKKLAIINEAMESSDVIRIKYTAKYYETSNYYKYFIGQNKGLIRLGVIEKKLAEENRFNEWANSDSIRKIKYGQLLSDMSITYESMQKYSLSKTYFNEAVFQGAELFLKAYQFRALAEKLKEKELMQKDIAAMIENLKVNSKKYFKNYDALTDQKLFGSLLSMYYSQVPKNQHPGLFAEIEKKYKGDFSLYAAAVYKTTLFADSSKFYSFLNNPTHKKLLKDPGFQAMSSLLDNYFSSLLPLSKSIEQKNSTNYRLYLTGLMEMYPERKFYPDANSTMRLTYGKVSGYSPMDGVFYDFFTTMDGIIEKRGNNNPDFMVPERLAELYKKKDFGIYGNHSNMNVCFITDNDITGGSSGSPVLNAKGELIGLAFDGNWESMSGELAYDPAYKRSINVDIRYVLFIIDKFAGAGHFIKEMKITGGHKSPN